MFFMDSRGELWLEYWSDVSKLTTATGNAFDASLALPEGYPLSSSTTIFKGGPQNHCQQEPGWRLPKRECGMEVPL